MNDMSDRSEEGFYGTRGASSRETKAVVVGIDNNSCNWVAAAVSILRMSSETPSSLISRVQDSSTAAAFLGGLENNLLEKAGSGVGEGTTRDSTTKAEEELAATDIQRSRQDC
jgi:hypothetical protein